MGQEFSFDLDSLFRDVNVLDPILNENNDLINAPSTSVLNEASLFEDTTDFSSETNTNNNVVAILNEDQEDPLLRYEVLFLGVGESTNTCDDNLLHEDE